MITSPLTRRIALVCFAVLGIGLTSCSPDSGSEKVSTNALAPTVAETEVVRVNGEAITEEQVAFTIRNTFANADVIGADQALYEKVVESLIASKAMRQAIEHELDKESLELIKRKVAAFEEELFVKAYLQSHAAVEPVSAEMVQSYYNEHPDLFGASEKLHVNILSQPPGVSEPHRKQLISQSDIIRKTDDWADISQQLKDLSVNFSERLVNFSDLEPKQRVLLEHLKAGETSAISLVDGRVEIFRLISRKQVPPKPLSQVSADIRKRLAAVQLKAAVKKASSMALDNATIEWVD